jgi:hypothetical protein
LIPTIVIEQELGKSIRIVEGLGPGVAGRYEVNADGKSIVIEDDGTVSTAYSVVFIDAENPADATIFSDHLTPAVANPKLKDKPYKIYRSPNGTAFVYDVDPDTGVGSYIMLGQASISEWHVTGVTNNFTLPTLPPNNRIALHVNGVLYSDSVYTLSGTSVEWSGSFDIATYDTVSVFFF